VETRAAIYQKDRKAEWLSGAYLAIRKDWYEKVGGLDAGFFMYSEDADWCYRIHRQGGTIQYLQGSVVTHFGGGSSGDLERLLIMRNRARDRYARLHFPPFRASLYRHILAFSLLLRALLFLPLTPFGSRFRKNLDWRLTAVKALYRDPLPLDPCYE
jgi:GT2 family glycosyltransferase